jgi:ribosomal subunit interface protein
VDIVVKGRHTEVSERYRAHVREKLARLARLDGKAFRVDVEISHESNPRLAGMSERIELTVYSRGPVIRAEAAAGDSYAALDMAFAKLEERLRRAADRRHARQHGQMHGAGAPPRGPVAEPLSVPVESPAVSNGQSSQAGSDDFAREAPDDLDDVVLAEGPLVVRQKVHEAQPMTLDEALHHMELLGHDFFLYSDAGCGLPSVVYRRRGYTYGVLRLQASAGESVNAAGGTLSGG